MASAKEIAKMLGISPSAVSMVFNNRPGVSDETRRRVFEAAKELGYQPKATAGKVAGSLQLIIYNKQVTLTNRSNSFFNAVIEGISTRVQALNYDLHMTYVTEEDLADSSAALTIAADSQGAILFASGADSVNERFVREFPLPLVVLDVPYDYDHVDSVCINNYQGIRLAVQHLYQLGHREIAYLDIDEEPSSFTNFSERRIGYGLAVSAYPELKHCANNVLLYKYDENGKPNIAEVLFAQEKIPTAIVCPNDWHASVCMRTLQDMGMRIPQDISVIGFDNIPLCELLVPPLTSIAVAKRRMGAIAVDRLVDVITTSPRERVKIETLTKLVSRESTGIAPKAR